MIQFKVIQRVGCYIEGLGSRPYGETFDVSADKAKRLNLDESAALERVTKPARKSKPKPADPVVDKEQDDAS